MPQTVVGAAPLQILDRNSKRKSLTFFNVSVGGQVIYIDNVRNDGMTVANAGYVLVPNGSVSFMEFFDGSEIKLPWSAISDGAGAILYHKELADREG
ncbi:MAG: hypothetical protein NWE89_04745 [Candidatus Bathyarchaeota archaeon]|nr:hypothetical protein [Candidatus Bathyarchaeota archaeon]